MNVVGYVRLSRDEDKENYSSIISQQDIINDYAAEKNWVISRMYIDDNCSGYSFDRPAFSEMIEEIEKGNIDIILSKDLSRIGRNNGKVLVLVDRLKELNKRLILITEGNGGLDLSYDDHDILGIKTWYNEMYIKDISRKIRANMHSKQKKGELIMGNFYGYNKVKIDNQFQLSVDEEIRPVIELIFESYIEGLGYKKICDILNEKGFPTPSEYIRQRHQENGRAFKNKTTKNWQTHMIKRIIQNDIYIGNLRARKSHSRLIKGKQERVSKEDQYVFHNNHEAIISKEDFKLAQEINVKRVEKGYRRNKAKYEYIFSSFMECGDCGYAVVGLNMRKYPLIQRGYNCTMYQRYGKNRCSNHAVKEDKVLFFFKEFLKDVKEEYEEYIANIEIRKRTNNLKQSISVLEQEQHAINDELRVLINQKIKDLLKESKVEYRAIIEKTYQELEDEKKQSILKLTQQIQELKKLSAVDIENSIKTNIEIFDDIINATVPSRKNLELILDKIIVYSDRTLEIKLKVNIEELIYKGVDST